MKIIPYIKNADDISELSRLFGPTFDSICVNEDNIDFHKELDIYVHNSSLLLNDYSFNIISKQLKHRKIIIGIEHTKKSTIKLLHKLYDPNVNIRIYLKMSSTIRPFMINSFFNKIKNELDPTMSQFGLCVYVDEYLDQRSTEDWLNELNVDSICIYCPDKNNKLTDIYPYIYYSKHCSIPIILEFNNYKSLLSDYTIIKKLN